MGGLGTNIKQDKSPRGLVGQFFPSNQVNINRSGANNMPAQPMGKTGGSRYDSIPK